VRPILDRCVFISFDLPSVKILRMMTGARVGWVLQDYSEAALPEAQAFGPDFLFCNLERIPQETTQLWRGPWQWAIYEVRDVRTAQRCHALGAAFVETMTVKGLLAGYEASRRQW